MYVILLAYVCHSVSVCMSYKSIILVILVNSASFLENSHNLTFLWDLEYLIIKDNVIVHLKDGFQGHFCTQTLLGSWSVDYGPHVDAVSIKSTLDYWIYRVCWVC